VNTPYISKLIRDGKFNEIKDIMEKGGDSGMRTFDQSLLELYKSEQISLDAALVNADSASELEWKINFGDNVKGGLEHESDDTPLEFPPASADTKD